MRRGMSMRRHHSFMRSILGCALLAGVTACNTGVTGPAGERLPLGSASQALLGSDIFGSDTLFDAMTAAFAAAPLSSPLVYRGTGSGNGERCLRGQAPP